MFSIRVGCSRLVADDSLTIHKKHSVGLVTPVSPVKSSLQDNFTVLTVEFETTNTLILTALVIPDLDLGNLNLWLFYLKESPIVLGSLGAAIRPIPQSELELIITGYFFDTNEIVVIVELVQGWEVFVLLHINLLVRL